MKINEILYTAAILVIIASSCSNPSGNTTDKVLATGYNDSGELLPYPKSDLISGFSIDTARLSIGHGDNWAITCADQAMITNIAAVYNISLIFIIDKVY